MKIMSFHNKHPVLKFSVSMGNKYIYIYILSRAFIRQNLLDFIQVGLDPYVCSIFSRVLVRKNKGYNTDKGLSLKYNTKN